MSLCSNRFTLPGSPSTCELDVAIVPLPSFCFVAAFLVLISRPMIKLNEIGATRLPYPRWLHTVYFILVVAAFAMTILELARLTAQDLGVGLLPITSVALSFALFAIWRERSGRTRTISSMLAAYWIFLSIVEIVKVVRLHLLEENLPTTIDDSRYPSSDQLLDNVVMLALYLVFSCLEVFTIAKTRFDMLKAIPKPLQLRGLR